MLAAAGSHFIATQQQDWPPLYALQCEAFDAVKAVLTAAGIRMFIKSPFHLISLGEAVIFVLIAVILTPMVTSFWGAAFTIANHYGTQYWVEWRNLGISNGVTTIVLVPVILIGVDQLLTRRFKAAGLRMLEGSFLGAAILVVGWLAFDRLPAGPETSPALIYAPVVLLVWAALRFGLGGMSSLHPGHHDHGDLGNDAWTWAVPDAKPGGKCIGIAAVHSGGGHSTVIARGRHRRGKTLEGGVAHQRGAHGAGGGKRAIATVGMGRAG